MHIIASKFVVQILFLSNVDCTNFVQSTLENYIKQ